MNNSKIRKQYEKSLNLLTLYYGKVGQNKKLFSQYEKFYGENKKKEGEDDEYMSHLVSYWLV